MSPLIRKALFISSIIFVGLISHAFPAQALSINQTESLSLDKTRSREHITRYIETLESPENAFSHTVQRKKRQISSNGCVIPTSVPNGIYTLIFSSVEKGQLAPHLSVIQLNCSPGYAPSSTLLNLCDDKKNDWFQPLATCQKICKPPKSFTVKFTCLIPSNNEEYSRGSCDRILTSGTIAYPTCQTGHHSVNPKGNIQCIDGSWGRIMPSCKAECGKEKPRGTPMVINGVNTVRGEFPWHVAIYTDYGVINESKLKYWCGGSIISRLFVISAAHCYYNALTNKPFENSFVAAAGKFYSDFDHAIENLDIVIQKSKIKWIDIPESYRGEASSYSHDLALLVLETPFVFSDLVMPVCINLEDRNFDSYQSSAGVVAKVAGFGLVQVDGNISDTLKTASMPIISSNQCIDESPQEFTKYIAYDKLCAGYKNGTAVCKGDSGGGLVVSTVEKFTLTWYLRGIVSTSPVSDSGDECTSNTYSTFTRPFFHKDFIEDSIQREGCVMPNNPPNGKFMIVGPPNVSQRPTAAHGSRVMLICDNGFVPANAEVNICDEFIDDWINVFSTCVVSGVTTTSTTMATKRTVTRPTVRATQAPVTQPTIIVKGTKCVVPKNTWKDTYGYNHHDELTIHLTLSCPEGFTKSSLLSVKCDGTQWVGVIPTCEYCGRALPKTYLTVNSRNVTHRQFPWHASIYMMTPPYSTPHYRCGGTILTRNIVITAANCFDDSRYPDYVPAERSYAPTHVVVGNFFKEYHHNEARSERYIQKVVVNDQANAVCGNCNWNRPHDIMILILDEPLVFSNFVMPICFDLSDQSLNERQLSPGVVAKMATFGNADRTEYPQSLDVLKIVSMPIISNSRCLDNSPEMGKFLSIDTMCAGQSSGSGYCRGEGGGGIVVSKVVNNTEIWYLRGVLSKAPTNNNGDCTTYSTFTTTFFHKYLIQHYTENDYPERGVVNG